MQRSFLIFATAFIAMMAGALFYAARIPVQTTAPAHDEPSALETAADAAAAEANASSAVYPQFNLPDLEGTPRSLSEWDGRYRLLNFWATWCAPCLREIPLLVDFQTAQGENGIQVIGVAVEESLEDVTRFAKDLAINYPNLIGFEDAMAAAESSGVEMIGMPFTLLLARDGELLNVHMGEIHQADLDKIAATLARLDDGKIDTIAAREALRAL